MALNIIASAKQGLNKELLTAFLVILCLSAYLAFYSLVGFNLGVYLFCFFLAGILIFLYPRAGVAGFVFCTLVFERVFTLTPIIINETTYKFYPLDLVLLIIAAAFLARFVVQRKKILNFHENKWLLISCFCFFLMLAISMGRSYLSGMDIASAFSVNKNFIFYSLAFFLVLALINDKKSLRDLLKVCLLGVICVLLAFLAGLIIGKGLFTEFIPLSTYGERYLGGGHSFYLALAALWILAYLIFEKKGPAFAKATAGKEKQWVDYLLWAVLFVSLIGLALSLLRHIWLGLALAIIFYFIFLGKKQKWQLTKILSILFLLAILAGLTISFINYWQKEAGLTGIDLLTSISLRVKSIFAFSYEDESAIWRREAWLTAWKDFIKHPVFGIGLGNKIKVELFNYESEVEVRDLHNDFVAVALQMGSIGLALFCWFLSEIGKRFYKLYKSIEKEKQTFFIASAASLILFIFSANFGTYFDINLLVIFFWILLALMLNSRRFA